ncbi:unnamed protein product [Pseudo-nitzschia multistriata]|uniref:Uncharacterized protein n=1 Tax=Pseudo-nitzschia multistriata TaxID=183589 RepID=A0A448ZR95_9STRA|nr:unnamed protein product [Pseudo-nitzschia multistriata]
MRSFMDDVDHAAQRVGAMTLAGFLGGAAHAAFKGFPRRAAALGAASSCALVGTSLFALERVASVAMRENNRNDKSDEELDARDDWRSTLSSHAFGGVFGGALNGYLYHRQPLRGMIAFTPFMLFIGMIEVEAKKRKQQRLDELLDQRQNQTQAATTTTPE